MEHEDKGSMSYHTTAAAAVRHFLLKEGGIKMRSSWLSCTKSCEWKTNKLVRLDWNDEQCGETLHCPKDIFFEYHGGFYCV